MKKILLALAIALTSFAASAVTYIPLPLISSAGSTSGQFITSTGPTTAPVWTTVTLSGLGGLAKASNLSDVASVSTSRTNLGLGTAAIVNTGTSGATIPLLSTANTWTLAQTFTVRPTFNGATPVDSANVSTFTTGRLLAVQVFAAGGTYTPTTGTTHAIVKVQGPGGGSGGTTTTGATTISVSAAGSAGSYAEVYWTSPTTQTVTIGAVGSAGAAAGAGGSGGASSIGAVVSCPGGVGGAAGAASTPPFTVTPAASPAACTITGPSTIISFAGSRSPFGIAIATTAGVMAEGAAGYLGATSFGTPPGYGSAGSSAVIGISATGTVGFAGSPSIVIVYDYQ